jgi:hypothetical protein
MTEEERTRNEQSYTIRLGINQLLAEIEDDVGHSDWTERLRHFIQLNLQNAFGKGKTAENVVVDKTGLSTEDVEFFFKKHLPERYKQETPPMNDSQRGALARATKRVWGASKEAAWNMNDYRVALNTLLQRVQRGDFHPVDTLEEVLANEAGVDTDTVLVFIREYLPDFKGSAEESKPKVRIMELPSNYEEKPARKVDQKIAGLLVRHRNQRNMTRAMVAERANMTKKLVRYIDYGSEIEIEPEWLEAYAAAVGTSGYQIMQQAGLL